MVYTQKIIETASSEESESNSDEDRKKRKIKNKKQVEIADEEKTYILLTDVSKQTNTEF